MTLSCDGFTFSSQVETLTMISGRRLGNGDGPNLLLIFSNGILFNIIEEIFAWADFAGHELPVKLSLNGCLDGKGMVYQGNIYS